jgi:hypothetical protein
VSGWAGGEGGGWGEGDFCAGLLAICDQLVGGEVTDSDMETAGDGVDRDLVNTWWWDTGFQGRVLGFVMGDKGLSSWAGFLRCWLLPSELLKCVLLIFEMLWFVLLLLKCVLLLLKCVLLKAELLKCVLLKAELLKCVLLIAELLKCVLLKAELLKCVLLKAELL